MPYEDEKQRKINFLERQLELAHQDIESLKKSKPSAFFEAAQQWRSIFDALSEIICYVDSDLKIIRCNRSMADFLKKPFSEIIGKRFNELLSDVKLADLSKKLFLEMKNQMTRKSEIIEVKNKWYEITMEPVIEQREKQTCAVIILRDITYLKKVEETLKDSHERIKKTLHGAINALATAIEKRDPFTAGHERRVAIIAREIGIRLGMPGEKTEGLLIIGMLHDIGKLIVPAEILSKPSRLNEYEYNIVKSHPFTGYEILKKIEFPWPVAETVLQHHERLDGSGYPYQITDEKIITEARIIAVADVFEAMTSHRPYRPAKTIKQVIDELQKSKGKLFDENVVDACTNLFLKENFVIE